MTANGETPTICETLGKPVLAYPDATSAVCANLTANMRHQQWPDWVSAREPLAALGHQDW